MTVRQRPRSEIMMGGSPRHHENVPPGWIEPPKPAGTPVWVPQPGSQTAFLSCPVFEVLYEGTRGPGKTDALLMDFAQHVGQGFGPEWRGVIFRQSYPQLGDLIAKSQKWFRLIWGDAAQYNQAKSTWTFPDGAAAVPAVRPAQRLLELSRPRLSIHWVGGADDLAD